MILVIIPHGTEVTAGSVWVCW